ncbi:MAG: hypothetical protein CM1200mP3_17000 [Chloroflexota bacterium]|nr:MAG: hypothetical protein CM1200mP3_17000 [Chloroflexota bacterium]
MVRAKGDYDLSLEVLRKSKKLSRNTNIVTKSGMMVGLGETLNEIKETMTDLRDSDCDLLTIGQYLRPTEKHSPISKWYTPSEFDILKNMGLELGFKHVASGPLVRSSYHADEQHRTAVTNLV